MPQERKTLPSSFQPPHAAPQNASCLSDDEILAFVQGELDERSLERVHVHVDECGDCQHLVAEATHALDSDAIAGSGRHSWNSVFPPGAIVARRYRVIEQVGEGGMGQVFSAIDMTLNERVALKTVTSTACDNERAVRQLKAEVQLARRITHPNVCAIYDLQTHAVQPAGDDISFLVMEFIDGQCLGKRLRSSGPLPLDLAQTIASQLLSGLAEAHRQGILHRDFKSENVMLRAHNDGRINAVILDFGLAKALNEKGSAVSTQTHGRSIAGTLTYMAPEQIEGKPLSRATDIYAFGVVFYEMLTGRLPFESGSWAASAVARLHRDATPPSTINPKIPAWLDAIVLHCLNREPSGRYENAQLVLDALEAATRAGSAPSSRQPWDRRRWAFAVLGLLTFVSAGYISRQGKPPVAGMPSMALTVATAPSSSMVAAAINTPKDLALAPDPMAPPTANPLSTGAATAARETVRSTRKPKQPAQMSSAPQQPGKPTAEPPAPSSRPSDRWLPM